MTCCDTTTDGAADPSLDVDVRRLLPGGPTGAVAPANNGIPNASSGTFSYVRPSGTPATLLDTLELMRWTAVAGAGSTAGHRSDAQIWNRTQFGGFTIRFVVHLQTFDADFRCFVGLRAATAVIPSANVSTLTNVVGFGFDPAGAQWASVQNDAAGAATITNLGAGFVQSTADVLLVTIEADRSGSEFRASLDNLTTGAGTGVLTFNAEIPGATLSLSSNAWYNSGAEAATQATIDLAEIESRTTRLAA